MKLLGIETATVYCSVGLSLEGTFIGEVRIRGAGRHAEVIAGMIHNLLEDAGWQLDELDGVGVSIGPGSFTGLRIGLGVAKGLALGLERPLIPIPTMEAVLWHLPPVCSHACVLITSRKNEVYRGIYSRGKDDWIRHEDIQAVPLEEWNRDLPDKPFWITGEAADMCSFHSTDSRFVRVPGPLALPSGFGVAACAAHRVQNGGIQDDPNPVPLYVKRFQGVE